MDGDGAALGLPDGGGGDGSAGRRINDAPLRAALENRRGKPFDEAISGVCYTHGVRLGLAGEALPDWLPSAPRWARQSLRAGHASGSAISGRGAELPV